MVRRRGGSLPLAVFFARFRAQVPTNRYDPAMGRILPALLLLALLFAGAGGFVSAIFSAGLRNQWETMETAQQAPEATASWKSQGVTITVTVSPNEASTPTARAALLKEKVIEYQKQFPPDP